MLIWGLPMLYLGVAANRQRLPIALPHQSNLQMAGNSWFKVHPYCSLPPESESMMLSCPWVLEGKKMKECLCSRMVSYSSMVWVPLPG